jgi:hypothetical protein
VKGPHELVKLDSDALEEHIKSAVAKEQAPQDQLSTSSEAAVSEPGHIRQSSNEELLSIHIGWQELSKDGTTWRQLWEGCWREWLRR